MHRKLKTYIAKRLAVTLRGTRRNPSVIVAAAIVLIFIMTITGVSLSRQSASLPSTDDNAPASVMPVQPAPEVHDLRQERLQTHADESVTLYRPVQGECIAGYGWGWSPVLREWRLHPGCDLHARAEEQVVAIADGTVLETGLTAAGANNIVIDHNSLGVVTYGNLGVLFFEVGDEIQAGEILGTVSAITVCHDHTGTHLHVEWRVDGHVVDPSGRLPH